MNFKYIDFSKAVDADKNREWAPGMLEYTGNPVHPSNRGAIVLYKTAIETCPELLTGEESKETIQDEDNSKDI